jgi:iron uptake system component EfeO
VQGKGIAVRVTRAALSLLLVAGLCGCTSDRGQDPAATARVAVRDPSTELVISTGACGQGWKDAALGRRTFQLRNTDTRPGDAYLIDAATDGVVAAVDGLGPGTTTPMTVDLGGGRYRFECAMEDADIVRGPVVSITGAPSRTVAVRRVSMSDLIPATKGYEAYVRGRLPGLIALVDRLDRDVRTGHLAKARTHWLPAHLAYERLGAAYGAFGDIDAAINGRASGLRRGVRDGDFTGFHRIEYGLCHRQSATAIRPDTARLRRDVRSLVPQFTSTRIDPLDVSIRAHEITENALQFELSGKSDYGSGSGLATVRANLDGTRVVLDLLVPLLTPRYPASRLTTDRIARAVRDLDATRRDGVWSPLTALNRPDRERINADISELTELLAPVATILEPRRTS